MRELLSRLLDRLRRRRLQQDLDDELAFHRLQIEREAIARGATSADARREARARLGNPAAIREATRDRWGFPSLDAVARDVRYAARALRRSPAFSLGVIATLSLGIGANAAMFDVTDRLMFRPLANLRDPGTVHRLYLHTNDRNGASADHWVSYGRYEDFRNWTHTFSTIAGFNERLVRVGIGESARERQIAAVSASFFDLFDAPPARGRYFRPAEDVAPGGAPVSVIAYDFWQREYGGREVLGETLQVGSLSTTVIGVAHRSMRGVNDAIPPSVFVPITSLGPIFGGQLGAQQSVGYRNLWGSLLVRRKPGVAAGDAARDATEAFRRSWEAQGRAQPGVERASVEEAQPRVTVGSVRLGGGPAPALEVQTALWVAGVAVIVLLIACANLCNLMLSRAVARQQEIATLTALGAGRGRLLTRALAETLLLAAVGAAGAVAIAQRSVASILGLLIPNATDLLPVTSPRTLAATGLTALTIGVVLGVAPMALMATPRWAGSTASAARGATARTSRFRGALVVVQAALSLVLLVGALLFSRSLDAVRAMPYGYDAGQLLLVNTVFRGPALPPAERVALQQRLLDAARALPGVEAAAWKVSTPLGLNASMRFFADGVPSLAALGQFTAQSGSPDYFAAMGTRILRGRGFTPADRAGAPPIVVVSSGMAQALWPDQDPIGRCLRFGSTSAPCTSVVGVAEDVVQTSITAAERYQYYLPLDAGAPTTGMVVRFRGSPRHHAEMTRQTLQALMPGLSYVTTQPLEELVTRAQRSWRLGATMFMVLGGLALTVAAVGLYGVIRYSVAQRRREMSVRAALGAGSGDLVRLIVGPNLRLTGLGIVAGAAIAVAARANVQPLLFEQSATDPTAFLVAAAVLGVAAFAASLVPALRAARVPPGEALRAE